MNTLHHPKESEDSHGCNVNVYIRCASHANTSNRRCVKVLPDRKSLTVADCASAEQPSLELFDAQHIFADDSNDNASLFSTICSRYLDDLDSAAHPVFVALGCAESGKTHSIIGNVDEREKHPLDGILVQFASTLLSAGHSVSLCGLEEYGESLSSLKLYDLFGEGSTVTSIDVESVSHLEQLMVSGCERIHCGLAGNKNKIVSYGHCLFQLTVDGRHPLSFFDLAGFHDVSPSNLTLNRLLQILYHRNRAQFKLDSDLNVHAMEPGLIPNLQRILQSKGGVDIHCILHISDAQAQRDDTLKTLQIARMFAKEPKVQKEKEKETDSIECFAVEQKETMKKSIEVKSQRIETLERKVTEMEGEIAELKRTVRKSSSSRTKKAHIVSYSEEVSEETVPLLESSSKSRRHRRADGEGDTCSFTCYGCCVL